MVELFGTTVVRIPARRGQGSSGIKRPPGCWPPADRDPIDVALVGVPRDMILLLLLFAESNRWLRIADIADA